jgi:hypothetical protein
MPSLVVILLILVAVKFVFIAVLLGVVFKEDLRSMRQKTGPQPAVCMYCQSVWTRPVDEGQTRWEGDDLVLVTTYECEHCHLPFWHVERVPMGSLKA